MTRNRKVQIDMATATKQDYYELLGVPRKASAKDIRAAFRKLAEAHLTGPERA